ncbi:hypothetical protein GCM10011611_37880 [Aliidongia dinghuensis]|uniref:Transmembrane protein n=2 Tax=Aliidongia dinghuensis TaxID=1867774 RepID=A0A8J2YVM2_9PROT|nr:hypothetical protein GCM10011611_37880 [Aliidongia dinghuensis]
MPTLPSLLSRTGPLRLVAALPMTMWLSFMLIFGMPVRSWALYLPFFLLLDFLRHCARPNRAAYMGWLVQAMAALPRGDAVALPAAFVRRRVWCGRIVLAFWLYGLSIIFVPQARYLARALDGVPAIEWLYGVIDQLYPAAIGQVAHIVVRGHLVDAYDLRHFLTMCLLLSCTTLFLYSGPNCAGSPEFLLLKPISISIKRKNKKFRINKLLWQELFCVLLSAIFLWVFTLMGSESPSDPVYWQMKAFPPCVMFMLNAWATAAMLAHIAAWHDLSLAEKICRRAPAPVRTLPSVDA